MFTAHNLLRLLAAIPLLSATEALISLEYEKATAYGISTVIILLIGIHVKLTHPDIK